MMTGLRKAILFVGTLLILIVSGVGTYAVVHGLGAYGFWFAGAVVVGLGTCAFLSVNRD